MSVPVSFYARPCGRSMYPEAADGSVLLPAMRSHVNNRESTLLVESRIDGCTEGRCYTACVVFRPRVPGIHDVCVKMGNLLVGGSPERITVQPKQTSVVVQPAVTKLRNDGLPGSTTHPTGCVGNAALTYGKWYQVKVLSPHPGKETPRYGVNLFVGAASNPPPGGLNHDWKGGFPGNKVCGWRSDGVKAYDGESWVRLKEADSKDALRVQYGDVLSVTRLGNQLRMKNCRSGEEYELEISCDYRNPVYPFVSLHHDAVQTVELIDF